MKIEISNKIENYQYISRGIFSSKRILWKNGLYFVIWIKRLPKGKYRIWICKVYRKLGI